MVASGKSATPAIKMAAAMYMRPRYCPKMTTTRKIRPYAAAEAKVSRFRRCTVKDSKIIFIILSKLEQS